MKKLLRVSAIVILLMGATAVTLLYQTLFADLPTPGEIDDHLIVPSVQIVDRAERPSSDFV